MNASTIRNDKPLKRGFAIEEDKLQRLTYATSLVSSLKKLDADAGLAVSIEGAWGSGKTSTLAMIEELLEKDETQPIIVHFNPWLIGDRDALLQQFLMQLSSAIEFTDYHQNGKKLADALTEYSHTLDYLKYLPNSEWTEFLRPITELLGKVIGSWASYKKLGIERRKNGVEQALKEFGRPIIVLIDDIDRLYPLEVFEMIRIVKAVGELPYVGYVLCWDSDYVSKALGSAGIPNPESYLDKVVQVRMPLPPLSSSAKEKLFGEGLDTLNPNALDVHFETTSNRLSNAYYYGLEKNLEQPRDFTRVFNTVSVIEPALRGEVALSDIIGLAILMIKCAPIFEQLQRSPSHFVGHMPNERGNIKSVEDTIKAGSEELKAAYGKCKSPSAAALLVYFLFPLVAKCEGKFSFGKTSDLHGHIAHPSRLAIALQMCINPHDVSLVKARRYIDYPEQREEIVNQLTTKNCNEFLAAVGNSVDFKTYENKTYKLFDLCVDLSKLPDSELMLQRSRLRGKSFGTDAETIAIAAIQQAIASIADEKVGADIAAHIVRSGNAITVSARILLASYDRDASHQYNYLKCSESVLEKRKLLYQHKDNLIAAILNGNFWSTQNPGFALWTYAMLNPAECGEIFSIIHNTDPTLDLFAENFLGRNWDSVKGDSFSLPDDISLLEAYCPLDVFKVHAQTRLNEPDLGNPIKAAWRSVVENKRLYAIDGTEAKKR